MKKVSIILLSNEGYLQTRYCYETLVSKIKGIEAEIFVIMSNQSLEEANKFKEVVTHENETIKFKDYETTVFSHIMHDKFESNFMNQALKQCNSEYICILTQNILLDESWLSDLIHFYETIDKSGVVSISDGFENLAYLPLMSEGDKFVNVMLPEVSWVKDVCFFKREFLNHVGCFDEEIYSFENSLKQLCLRFTALGYNNYYIPSQTCVKVNGVKGKDVNQDKKEQKYIVDSLFEMKQRKSYYLPLK